MTPLHLEILLHYYSCTDDFSLINENKVRMGYAYTLSQLGYLYTPANENIFAITTHGRRKINIILNEF